MRVELKRFRVTKFLTQQEMADKVGVSVTTYNLVENGQRRGSIEFWLRLQDAFQMDDATVWKLQKNII